MLRRVMLFSLLFSAAGCATEPPTPVVWYVVSPVPTPTFPIGNLNSSLATWEKLKDFPTGAACQDQLIDVHNAINRPVDCVASNDPRLAQR